MPAEHSIARPDGQYLHLIERVESLDLSQPIKRIPVAEAGADTLICGGYILQEAAKKALALQDGPMLAAPRLTLLADMPAPVAEHVGGVAADDVFSRAAITGLFDNAWLWDLFRRLAISKAKDPAILDTIAAWIAPTLVS